MQSSINQAERGLIAYTVDGKEASRPEALAAWQLRDTSAVFQGSVHMLARAEELDNFSPMARVALARVGIQVHHLPPALAVAYWRGERLCNLICTASAATAPTAQVRP